MFKVWGDLKCTGSRTDALAIGIFGSSTTLDRSGQKSDQSEVQTHDLQMTVAIWGSIAIKTEIALRRSVVTCTEMAIYRT